MRTEPTYDSYDVIVIGGGFYGCCVALLLREYCSRILIIEREADLLLRASLVNQARVHNGYHYPRSYLTALRSYINFPQFVLDFEDCIDSSFEKVYAIARNQSKVTAFQFQKTFSNIGAPVSIAPQHIKKLFNRRLIEEVFCVKEYAFDAVKLRKTLQQRLCTAGIEVIVNSAVNRISAGKKDTIQGYLDSDAVLSAKHIFNCAYAGINELLSNSMLQPLPMKYELAEIALINVPDPIKRLGITLMDGPFFSTMPFPSRNLHSLSHVRYTPHESWQYQDRVSANLYTKPANRTSNAIFMMKDAQRYLPILQEAQHIDSLYEVKTILLQNEVDDGRPILFRRDYGLRNHSLIAGGKIDNIYDILKKIESAEFFTKRISAIAS